MPARNRLPGLVTRAFASHKLQSVQPPHQVPHYGTDDVEIEEKCGNDLRLGDKSGDSTGEDLAPVDFRSELLQHRLESPERLAACLMITKYRIGPLGATASRAYDRLGARSGRASWSCRRRGWCSTLPGRSAPGIPYHRLRAHRDGHSGIGKGCERRRAT